MNDHMNKRHLLSQESVRSKICRNKLPWVVTSSSPNLRWLSPCGSSPGCTHGSRSWRPAWGCWPAARHPGSAHWAGSRWGLPHCFGLPATPAALGVGEERVQQHKRCCISDLRVCVCVLHFRSQGVCVCVCVCVCVHVMLCEDGEAGDASETGRTGHAWRKVGCSPPEA